MAVDRLPVRGTGPRRMSGAYRCAARRSGSVGTTGYPRVRLRKATLQPDTPLISEPDRTAVPLRAGQARHTAEAQPQMASMALNDLGPMLTASEVAEMLHLHVNTVKRLGDRGELPFYRVCKRGDRRFRLEDVMAFLARNR
jgi:excisionase family DNA binding protein